jgi:hypothetical protein
MKIYLDTKDYIRISEGILRNSGRREDLEAYNVLLSLVKSGRITVYFSWCHYYEALKYEGQTIVGTYCDVVDSLTQGNCIVYPLDLEKRELEIYMSKSFGFHTSVSGESYPYGKTIDAFGGMDFEVSPLESMRKTINSLPIPIGKKAAVLHQIKDPRQRRKLFRDMPDDFIETFKKNYPGFEGRCSRGMFLDILDGTEEQVKEKFENFFRSTFTFKNTLMCYKNKFPKLKELAMFWDSQEAELVKLIKTSQNVHSELGISPIEVEAIARNLMERLVDALENEIEVLSDKYAFSSSNAKQLLIDSKLQSIPCRHAMLLSIAGYLEKNKGDLTHGRTPHESDLRDIFHSIAIPYVDYYVTDRFFSSISKKYSSTFNTKVVRNLQQLQEIIGNK